MPAPFPARTSYARSSAHAVLWQAIYSRSSQPHPPHTHKTHPSHSYRRPCTARRRAAEALPLTPSPRPLAVVLQLHLATLGSNLQALSRRRMVAEDDETEVFVMQQVRRQGQ